MSIFGRYTIKSLCQNKVRTFVTIVGVVLSVAMITAVTTSVSSLSNYMLEVIIENRGCWHVSAGHMSQEEIQTVLEKTEVGKSAVLSDVAYGKLTSVKHESMPYLYIGGFSGDFAELLSLRMKEGRLPENSSELILPSGLVDQTGISYEVGESVEIETGVRKQKGGGEILWQEWPYDETEIFESDGIKAYKIVGVYESADFGYWDEEQGTAGFPVLTRTDALSEVNSATGSVSTTSGMVYVTLKDLLAIDDFIQTLEEEGQEYVVNQNDTYVRVVKGNWEDSMFRMLIYMAMILIGIIMFGSISLICNSFAISVNERKRQFALLTSFGATRKQLRSCVLFEALVLSLVGIPVGILIGIGGMAFAFYVLRDTFQTFLGGVGSAGNIIHMSAAMWAVLLAAAVGFITVLISAYLPTRKALRSNVMDVIYQTEAIAVRLGELRTFGITQKIFGLAGMLGSKNYKRNKKRYRATVFSLFISVVLFISASSFTRYLSDSLQDIIKQYYDCDIRYQSSEISMGEESEALFQKMEQVSGLTDKTWHYNFWEARIEVPESCLTEDGVKNAGSTPSLKEDGQDEKVEEGNVIYSNIILSFVEDGVYEAYLREHGLDVRQYMDPENLCALVFDKDVALWSSEENRYVYTRIFQETPQTAKLSFEVRVESGDTETDVEDDETEREGDWLGSYISGKKTITIGEIRNETMKGFDYEQYMEPVILFPMSAMEVILPDDAKDDSETVMTFRSENPNQTYIEMTNLQEADGYPGYFENVAEQIQISRAMMTILNIFSYGFILLISLIAVANVFNTISTNIFLRRREFAMLRSVGMTQKEFHRMMNYECILYGMKGLVYGLPVAVGVTALIWYVVKDVLVIRFYVSWQSIVIAVGSVFLVVFATMLYSVGKIRKDNVADTLKREYY